MISKVILPRDEAHTDRTYHKFELLDDNIEFVKRLQFDGCVLEHEVPAAALLSAAVEDYRTLIDEYHGFGNWINVTGWNEPLNNTVEKWLAEIQAPQHLALFQKVRDIFNAAIEEQHSILYDNDAVDQLVSEYDEIFYQLQNGDENLLDQNYAYLAPQPNLEYVPHTQWEVVVNEMRESHPFAQERRQKTREENIHYREYLERNHNQLSQMCEAAGILPRPQLHNSQIGDCTMLYEGEMRQFRTCQTTIGEGGLIRWGDQVGLFHNPDPVTPIADQSHQ